VLLHEIVLETYFITPSTSLLRFVIEGFFINNDVLPIGTGLARKALLHIRPFTIQLFIERVTVPVADFVQSIVHWNRSK
jgi:hypothetical protein